MYRLMHWCRNLEIPHFRNIYIHVFQDHLGAFGSFLQIKDMQCYMNVSQRCMGQCTPAKCRTVKRGSISSTRTASVLWDSIETASDPVMRRCYVDCTCAGDLVLCDKPQDKSAELRQPKSLGIYQRLYFETMKVCCVNCNAFRYYQELLSILRNTFDMFCKCKLTSVTCPEV